MKLLRAQKRIVWHFQMNKFSSLSQLLCCHWWLFCSISIHNIFFMSTHSSAMAFEIHSIHTKLIAIHWWHKKYLQKKNVTWKMSKSEIGNFFPIENFFIVTVPYFFSCHIITVQHFLWNGKTKIDNPLNNWPLTFTSVIVSCTIQHGTNVVRADIGEILPIISFIFIFHFSSNCDIWFMQIYFIARIFYAMKFIECFPPVVVCVWMGRDTQSQQQNVKKGLEKKSKKLQLICK
jgi:hypothetical protein